MDLHEFSDLNLVQALRSVEFKKNKRENKIFKSPAYWKHELPPSSAVSLGGVCDSGSYLTLSVGLSKMLLQL